jgi:hypothetical protein
MEGSNETGWDLNTATRRQRSADAVGSLGMLGKYTDGIRETGLDCLTEAWLALHLLALHMAHGQYHRCCLPM